MSRAPETRILFEEKQERVQDAPRFADVVAASARCGKRIDLVKEVDAALGTHRIEDGAQFSGGLAIELADQPMQLH